MLYLSEGLEEIVFLELSNIIIRKGSFVNLFSSESSIHTSVHVHRYRKFTPILWFNQAWVPFTSYGYRIWSESQYIVWMYGWALKGNPHNRTMYRISRQILQPYVAQRLSEFPNKSVKKISQATLPKKYSRPILVHFINMGHWAQWLINLEIPVLVWSLKSSNVELG